MFANVNYNDGKEPSRDPSSLTDYSSSGQLRPYELIADPATGKPADVFFANPRSITRYQTITGMKPINYNPLIDLTLENSSSKDLQARLGGTVNILLTEGLNLQGGGMYSRGSGLNRSLSSRDSYKMRAAYNDASSISDPAKHYIPDGDMINESRNMNEEYTLRSQLSFDKTIGNIHRISLLAGTEIRREVVDNNSYPTR